MAVMNDDFKEKVRQSSDIVDVISGYVPLKKRGHDYWACCPFHGDKNPSFSVSKEKQLFYCHGCHVGGDVFEFVRKIENCTFPEALKILANKANIPIPEFKKTAEERARAAQQAVLENVNELAARYFEACLQKTDFGKKAIAYLHARGIMDETIAKFSLGAALPSYHALLFNLQKHGCSIKDLAQAGLIRERNGRYHDLFFNRVMIPIKDARGKVVAFGGRVLDDGIPKYLNTGETVLFQKRELLFGLDIAIKAIRMRRLAVVVEGYMDAISLHAAGIDYAVASLGTAFSKEHAKMLARLADTVVLSYDSDDAGKRSAVRAVSILKENDVPVKVLSVPEVKDPDEYVRKCGKEAFEKLVTAALDGTEFQIRYTISKNNNDNLAGKVKTVSNLIPFLIESKNTIARAGYVRLIAQLLTVDEDLIMGEYRKGERKIKTSVPDVSLVDKQRDVKSLTALDQAERTLLRTFMQSSALIGDYLEAVKQIGFSNPIRQTIFDAISTMSGKTQAEITGSFSDAGDGKVDAESDEVKGKVSAEVALIMISDHDDNFSNERAQTMVRDCIRQMQHSRLDKEFEEHSKLAVAYEKAGDPRFMEELRMSQAVKDKIKRLYGDN
jgi:DNA primase